MMSADIIDKEFCYQPIVMKDNTRSEGCNSNRLIVILSPFKHDLGVDLLLKQKTLLCHVGYQKLD
jgi:hypothetical protein